MKSLWKFISLLSILALLIGACAQVTPPPAEKVKETVIVYQPQTVKETVVVKETVEVPAPTLPPIPIAPVPAPATSNPLVLAVKVSSLPTIDADTSDEQWKDAPISQIGGMQWQAVYTDKDLALLIKWLDREVQMNAPGTYLWDPKTKTWSQSDGFRSEWMNLSFDISSSVGTEGCDAFCHEDPPGSGEFHHQTGGSGQTVDSWMLFGKHGFTHDFGAAGTGLKLEDYGLKIGREDSGWFMGVIKAVQNSPLVFDQNNTKDPRTIIAGDVTFIDYAEDNVITYTGDPIDSERNRPRDAYCMNCHNQIKLPYDPLKIDVTYPDDGKIKYDPNWEVPYTTPTYIETNPTDFVDAMTLTQDEVDSGEAVKIASLSPDQISEYWSKYDAVNGTVPYLVLKETSGSIADVLVASNWKNGVWTMELTRHLSTPYGREDVQFDDLTKDYPFSLTITTSNQAVLLGDLLSSPGGILRFRQ